MLSLGVQELSVGGPRGRGADEVTVQAGPIAGAWLAVGRVEGSAGSSPGRGGVSLEQEGRLERGGGSLREESCWYRGEACWNGKEGADDGVGVVCAGEKRGVGGSGRGGEEKMAEGVGGMILEVSCLISLKGRYFRRWVQEGGIMM